MSGKTMKRRVLDFITDYIERNGYSPSYREIGPAVGLRSSSSVNRYVEVLKEEGKLIAANPKAQTFTLARSVDLSDTNESPHRIRLEAADGGVLYVDCAMTRREFDSCAVSFSGVIDASQLKGKVSRVVNCRVDNGA